MGRHRRGVFPQWLLQWNKMAAHRVAYWREQRIRETGPALMEAAERPPLAPAEHPPVALARPHARPPQVRETRNAVWMDFSLLYLTKDFIVFFTVVRHICCVTQKDADHDVSFLYFTYKIHYCFLYCMFEFLYCFLYCISHCNNLFYSLLHV